VAADVAVKGRTLMKDYIVACKAGYQNKFDVKKLSRFNVAFDCMYKKFSEEEIQEFHIAIALENDGERTYEF
jgi:hypothetical protein